MLTGCTLLAGDVVAIYHYQEGETEKGPAIVGESALLAASQGQYRVRPCGYRRVSCFAVQTTPGSFITLCTPSNTFFKVPFSY